MNLHIVIPSLSLTIQLISFFYAVRMVRYTGNRIIGIVFVLAIFLMSFRRFISLYRFFSDGTITVDIFAETVALIISALILFGIILISRFLKSAAEDKRAAVFNDTLYRTLFNQSPDGVLLVNMEGAIVEFNDAVNEQLGYTREEFKKLRIEDIDPVESPEEIKASVEKVLREGKDQFEVKHITKQGEERDVLVMVQKIELSGKIFFQTIWRDITEQRRAEKKLITDITERKKVEEALRESEDKFRSIFDEAIDGIMIADAETKRQLEANKAICGMLGYSREELVGLRMEDIHPKEALPGIRELFEKQLRGEISLAPEIPLLRKNGSVFYADVNATSVTLGGKQCLVGIFRDITERKRAEDQLNMLGGLVDIAPASIMIHDFEGNIFYANQKALDMHGYAREEFLSLTLRDLDVPESAALIEARMRQIAENGSASFEAAHYKKGGTVLPLEVFVKMTEWDEKTVVFSIGTDITERKKAEQKIQKSEEFIRTILDTVHEGFIVVDQDYRILTANSAYCDQVGHRKEKIIGKNCHAVRHKKDRPCHEEGVECAVQHVFETGRPHTAVHRHTNTNGKMSYVEVKGYPIKDTSGAVTSVIEIIRDFTEKYLLEEERLKSQKLESIGTLAGGIAHDFNNLLQGVFGFISLAKISYDRKDELLSLLGQAEEALHLSVNLTNQLLTFSKGGKPVKKLIGVAPVVENAVKFALSGSHTNYELDTKADLWSVEADEGQLAQVIQNITLNANQAMTNGGTIRVTLSNEDIARETLTSLPGGGHFVSITIQDSGVGINEHDLARIFDPYFTTKSKGQGLGLATSYSIIKNHGGVIMVQSEVNRGSRFSIYIPASKSVATEITSIATDVIATNKGKILLMDDEAVIRRVAKKMLAALGQDVIFAEDGLKAIDLFRKAKGTGDPFNLVILDLTVKGGMGGEEAIRKIREIDPEVKAVVSSGYADSPVIANYRAFGFSAVLSKPYRLNALKNCLDTLFH